MPDDAERTEPGAKRSRRDADLESARLWQQILGQELRHRRDMRALFERHERLYGQKVRQLRTERGWTQAQLAERLNELGWPLHQTTVAKLEAGTRPIRIAEADALAIAFGLPQEALWYLPVEGEPWSLAQMKEELESTERSIREITRQLHDSAVLYAEMQTRRMHLAEAMNEAALAASRGEIEDPGWSAEDTEAIISGWSDKGREEILAAMTPEQRATLTHETLERLHAREPERLAAELWGRYSAGESPESIARFLAEHMPSEVEDALTAATALLRKSLGWPGAPTEARDPNPKTD